MFFDGIVKPVLFSRVAAIAMVLSGCTILEDRDSCPSRLILDLTEVKECEGLDGSLALHVSMADTLVFDEFKLRNIPDTHAVALHTRGTALVAAFTPGDAVSEDGLTIREGLDCPALWTDFRAVDVDKNEVVARMGLHKNHCRLTMKFVKGGGSEDSPFSLTVTGKVDGYHPDGTPSEGPFRFTMKPDSKGEYHLNLPRQTDNSLMLEISSGGDTVRSFAIGEYLAESGYDWDALDLEDASMEIDYSLTTVTLRIEEWTKTLSFEVVI